MLIPQMQASAGSMLRVTEVTDVTALERLRPEWSELWEQLDQTTPFQSPAWIIPWWRNLGAGRLWAITVRTTYADANPGRLVGLAPLYIHPDPVLTTRQVFPVGIGTTDYLDGLFAPGYESLAAEAVFAHLDMHRDRWDNCEFPQLPGHSPLLRVPVPDGWDDQIGSGEPCPTKQWNPDATSLRDCLSSSFHKLLRQQRRRAEAMGARIVALDKDNLEEMLNSWFRLHNARWTSRGEAGVLADSAVRRMHEQALPELLTSNIARTWALHLDGKTVAVLYGLADHAGVRARRVYYYLGGFDPEYHRLSPGKLMIAHAIEEAICEGACEFDFLRGREDYKYVWGAKDRFTFTRRMTHSA